MALWGCPIPIHVCDALDPGLSKIPARVGGPGSDIINLEITIRGQKLGAGRFLIHCAGRGSHVVYQNLQVLLNMSKGSKCRAYCMKCNPR